MQRFTNPRDIYHGKGALEALKTLEAHIRQFNKLYSRDEKTIQDNKKRSRRNTK